ncbi:MULTISPECIES: hypothetical protein [unclassified Streptomyces]|uniref:hypothetical protein n=1 Tax=unclassified Streptomyces TaxID=2593676 RepID=UPI00039BFABD|nr:MULTISPECIES: hypothetical protein [unclassified Streptomyces]MYY05785.1 hypothetical protein [Streptomyces sp. SID4913]
MGLMSWLRGGRTTGRAMPPEAPGRGDRADRVDVNRLDPVQWSVTGQDLLTDPGGFEASLTTRQEPSLGRPLGHLVSPQAPAGLVRGVADPAPGSPAPAPAAQRSVDMPMPARGKPQPGAVAVQRAYGDGPPALTSAEHSSASAGLPVRQLLGEQPLVEPGPTDERVSGGTNAGPFPPPDASPGAPAVQRTTAAEQPPPPRPTAGGLGAPLPGLPPTAQRRVVRPPAAPEPAPRPPLVQRDTAWAAPDEVHAPANGPAESASGPAVPEASGSPDAPDGTEAVAPLLGDDPLTGPAVSGGEPAETSGGHGAAPGGPPPAAPVQRSAAVPGATPVPPPAQDRPTAPLLGDRPLILRTADAPGTSGTPAGAPAAVQRAAGGGPGKPSAPDPAAVPSHPAAAVRWVLPDADEVPRPLPPAVSPVQRQTHAPPARPQPAPGGHPPASAPTAGAVAVAAGVAQRMADGSVVFASAPRAGTSRPVVQRDSEIAEEPPPPPLPEPEAGPQPVPDAEPPSGAEPPTAEQGGGDDGTPAGAGGAPPVTDELVRALYAPLSRLLKADLRLERERSGFLINTRH